MIKDLHISEVPQKTLSMHPKKFLLWLFITTIIMLFAAFTSAYVVRQSEGNWFVFELPSILYYSSAVLLLSSVTMHWAYVSAKNDNLGHLKIAAISTLVLGMFFLGLQFMGWEELVAMNVFFVGNPAGSFLYIITGLHGVHIISGIIFLIILLVAAFKYKVHSRNMVLIEMSATFWHFLDVLWIYLFIFLILNR